MFLYLLLGLYSFIKSLHEFKNSPLYSILTFLHKFSIPHIFDL